MVLLYPDCSRGCNPLHPPTPQSSNFLTAGSTFEVPPGRIVGLCGPNGAGKTTLLAQMVGLPAADALRPPGQQRRSGSQELPRRNQPGCTLAESDQAVKAGGFLKPPDGFMPHFASPGSVH
jgi:ABC transporter